MLKCCFRPLVTLVLALMATAVLSTLCPARELPSHDGSVSVGATGSAKPRPVAQSGEPDQPLRPPPLHHGGNAAPVEPESDTGEGFVDVFRWISGIWASWYAWATF